jgi:hypothetical protein
MLSTGHSCCLCNGYQPIILSACEFGSARNYFIDVKLVDDGAGLHFVMRSERMAVCHA